MLLFSHSGMSDSLWPHGLQHTRLPCPSLSLWVCSNSCPLSQWCHPTICPLSSPSPPAFSLSQHKGLFQWVGSSHHAASSFNHLLFMNSVIHFFTHFFHSATQLLANSLINPSFSILYIPAIHYLHIHTTAYLCTYQSTYHPFSIHLLIHFTQHLHSHPTLLKLTVT